MQNKMADGKSLVDIHERTGLVREALFVRLTTDTAHIVDESGETVCGTHEHDLDKIGTDDDGHVFYDHRYFGNTGLIHEDDTWSPGNKSLCHYCDQKVPDDLQATLFSDDKFNHVDGLTTEMETEVADTHGHQ